MNRTVGHILSIILSTTFAIITCRASEQTPKPDHKQLYEQAAQLMAEGNLSEAQLCFDKAFAIPDIEHSPIYPLLLNEQATLMTWRGERSDAINAKRSVIPYLDSFGDKELDISVYSDLGILYHRSNMTDSAIYFHEKADSVARVFGDPGWQASVTHNIGVMYYNLRRFNDAAQYLERAAQYAIDSNDTYSIICARQLLSVAETERGNIEEAGTQARMAWNDALTLDDKSLQLRCIPSLYRYFEAAGRNDSVDRYMDIGYDLYSQLPQNSVISLGYVMARARMHALQPPSVGQSTALVRDSGKIAHAEQPRRIIEPHRQLLPPLRALRGSLPLFGQRPYIHRLNSQHERRRTTGGIQHQIQSPGTRDGKLHTTHERPQARQDSACRSPHYSHLGSDVDGHVP